MMPFLSFSCTDSQAESLFPSNPPRFISSLTPSELLPPVRIRPAHRCFISSAKLRILSEKNVAAAVHGEMPANPIPAFIGFAAGRFMIAQGLKHGRCQRLV
jgi:hypothetical protein